MAGGNRSIHVAILVTAGLMAVGSGRPAHAAEPLVYPSRPVVAFVGQPVRVAPRARPVSAVRVEPPLPAGLSFDPATGVLSGRARAPAEGRTHLIVGGGSSAALWVEVLARPAPGKALFVAPDGSDEYPGTIERPFRTVAAAAAALRPGMTAYLRAGLYRGATELRDLRGTTAAPIAIRSYPGEWAVLDASEPFFVDHPRQAWEKAKGPGARPDEWVSTRAYPDADKDTASRGAFLERPAYTRLLTYSRIEDLRADNQTYEHLTPEDARPGPRVEKDTGGNADPGRPRRPWVYFGPGIHFDQRTARIHLRLSPTRNGVKGLEDYAGPRDPREMRLAISSRSARALGLIGARHVRIADLGLFHGGDDTVLVQGCSDVTLDHIEIRAATQGLQIAASERVRVLHTRIDGGMPPWSFRSDYKARYQFSDARGDSAHNDVVSKTARALLAVGRRSRAIEVAHCELENGHDAYVGDAEIDLHHNRIRNLHDEAIYMTPLDDGVSMRVHHNVIEKVLSAVSFRDGKSTGRRFIYRNVFDLREPTAGHRPDGADREVWRWGHLFKAAGPIGALYFYQNTALTVRPRGKAVLLHFVALEPTGVPDRPRWLFNNIFVSDPAGDPDSPPLSIVPHWRYLEAKDRNGPLLRSDGNLWVRTEPSQRPLFRCLSRVPGERCQIKRFVTLPDLVGARPPGDFEGRSRSARDPRLHHLRPRPGSPAHRAGISLPGWLPDPDRSKSPDIGALSAGRLRVGVDGRQAY